MPLQVMSRVAPTLGTLALVSDHPILTPTKDVDNQTPRR
jgi:hypothetical protein